MKKAITIILASAAALILPLTASAQELKLIPEPRQVQKREGVFTVDSKTRIVINRDHEKQDRVAAEMLAEEIEKASGKRIKITTAGRMPDSRGVIYLAQAAGDDRRLKTALEAKGLSIDEKFDEQGYVLDSSAERIVVAGRTGQGLFYGVQTLRQLLTRGSDKELICPAVSIKDWPALRWRGVHDDIDRKSVV